LVYIATQCKRRRRRRRRRRRLQRSQGEGKTNHKQKITIAKGRGKQKKHAFPASALLEHAQKEYAYIFITYIYNLHMITLRVRE